jgi:hypothetical protein
LAGNPALGLADVGNDRLFWLPAGGQAGEGHRSAHELDEAAPVDAAIECHRLLRELIVEEGVELVAARQLFEAAPVLAAAKVADSRAEGLEIERFLAHQSVRGMSNEA